MASRGVFVTHECHVVRFIPCKVVTDSNLRDTLRNGDDLIAEFKRRKLNFILCCYNNYMDVIEYFVVKA
jgi:hypothetical protein